METNDLVIEICKLETIIYKIINKLPLNNSEDQIIEKILQKTG